ncbi:hypothetical protein BYT27DRAFT_7210324 [Phlegmacium glaucopus]|nr:hypothetical protein BYT27DRAFT_7210324 [Phlegmacium glaucopus]
MGPGLIFLPDGLPVDWAPTVIAGCVEVDTKREVNVDPSEVISEFVVKIVGGGVVTTDEDVVVDNVSVEIDEVDDEVDSVDVVEDVGVEEVDESDVGVELEEHEDPKRVVNTVTGTSTVNVAGTVTVVVLPA